MTRGLLFAIAALALAAIAGTAAPSWASHHVVGRGHITATGPWTSTRSLTVLLDRDSVDGFFLKAPPAGTLIGTRTVDNSGRGYNLSVNFHRGQPTGSGPRAWISGCASPDAEERRCTVPEGAGTIEITGTSGMDLDVVVFLEHRPRR